jgi:hypothetical protein
LSVEDNTTREFFVRRTTTTGDIFVMHLLGLLLLLRSADNRVVVLPGALCDQRSLRRGRVIRTVAPAPALLSISA